MDKIEQAYALLTTARDAVIEQERAKNRAGEMRALADDTRVRCKRLGIGPPPELVEAEKLIAESVAELAAAAAAAVRR